MRLKSRITCLLACALFGTPAVSARAQQEQDLHIVDISGDIDRQVIVAQGTEKIYHGHPTTVLMPDNKTIYCVWTYGHGGRCGPMAKSTDAGRTWRRIDDTLSESWQEARNCPAIYRLKGPDGEERLFVFAGRDTGAMWAAHSNDNGETWTDMKPIDARKGPVMPWCTIMPIEDGRKLLAMTNIRPPGMKRKWNVVAQSVSGDGGFTWSPYRVVTDVEGRNLCEPFLLRSPDGKELCCLMREQTHRDSSMMMFSRDEGKTWSKPGFTSWGLTGDRHCGVRRDDGRWVIAFRDRAPGSPTRGHFVAWVGTYADIREGRPGQYRIKLLHSHAGSDCGYPGMELLPDGTILATTYIKYRPGKRKHSVVTTRFTLEETDQRLQEQIHNKSDAGDSK